MDVLDLFFKKFSYKFPKGYPDMSNPKEKEMLFEIIKRLTEEEKPKFNKQDLIDYINNLEDEEALNKILKFAKSTGFSKNVNNYLKDKNLTDKDITYFLSLVQDMDKLGEFAALAQNPPKLDLTKSNIYSQIPGFDPSDLKELFITMKDSIKGTVSLGPGENFLSIFFGNVAKEGSKGDLNVDGKEVELKARTGSTGAVVSPRIYNRGDFSKSIKPFITEFIKELGLEPDQENELEQINTPGGGSWPSKLNEILKNYLSFGKDKDLFIKKLNKMFKLMYRTLDINANDYIKDDTFDFNTFTIDLAKKLAKAYYDTEGFDGLMMADMNGNFKYYPEDKFIEDIGKEIKVSYPSDLLPRLKI
jgi:hypothetical protein